MFKNFKGTAFHEKPIWRLRGVTCHAF